MTGADVDDGLDLLEREAELEQIEAALRGSLTGAGGVLVIEGEPGIGKSSLLAAAQAIARDRGARVLAARASPLEREFPFGAVRQLLEPPLRSAAPARRGELLAGGAARAAPALGLGRPQARVSAPTGFGTLNGLYWLLANLAEHGPLALTLDDAQWADPATMRFLAFLAARIADLPVLLVVAARAREWDPAALLAASASGPAARSLMLAPLSPDATAAVVAARYGGAGGAELARACQEATAGNPFYLHTLLDELAGAGLEPSWETTARVRSLRPRGVAHAIVARLARLSPAAPALAGALAVLGRGAGLSLAARLAGLGDGEAPAAVAELVGASIVAPEGELRFTHPIVRNAVYGEIDRARRTELHREAARLLTSQHAGIEHVAAQLLQTDPDGREDVVATLRDAAAEALRRGASDSAVRHLRRALAEPPPTAERAGVLFELGLAESVIAVPDSLEHLREAIELESRPTTRASIALALARVLFSASRMAEAAAVAGPAAEGLHAGEDRELRRRLEAVLLAAASMEPSLQDHARELASRARTAAGGGAGPGVGATALVSTLLYVDARAGIPAREVLERAGGALGDGALLSEVNALPGVVMVMLAVTLAESGHGLRLLDTGLARAREQGDEFAIAATGTYGCLAHLMRGELAEAIAAGEVGLAVALEAGARIGISWAGAFLAAAQVERGELDAAERTLARAAGGAEVPETAEWHRLLDSRAMLLASRGEAREALATALEAGRRFEAVGGRNPAFVPWRTRAALCLTELGEQPGRARALAAEEVELARAWGVPAVLGAALRAHGLVLGGDDGLRQLHEAVAVLERSPARLEHARALVDLGAAIRGSGEPRRARRPLAEGLEVARSCGAVPLVERAYAELEACGARPRRIVATGVDALTPSELRVATLAAHGMMNRAIAERLFVTVKTVEFHLRGTFAKLQISAREQLGAALEERSPRPGAAGGVDGVRKGRS